VPHQPSHSIQDDSWYFRLILRPDWFN